MYRIMTANGTEIGVAEAPLYIKRGASGCFTPCAASDAIGIALDGTPYNLMGHDEITGAETVNVLEFDGGKMMTMIRQANANLDYLSMMSGVNFPEVNSGVMDGGEEV